MTFSFDSLDLSGVQEDVRPMRLAQGEHHVKISEAEVEQYNSNGSPAARINVTFKTPDDKGVISERYNVQNPSDKATEIGRSQLKSLLIAANHPSPDKPSDVASMLGLELKVYVGMGKPYMGNDGTQKQYTEVKRYMPLGGAASGGGGSSSLKDDKIPF